MGRKSLTPAEGEVKGHSPVHGSTCVDFQDVLSTYIPFNLTALRGKNHCLHLQVVKVVK